ncbi:MAG: MerR family transcriptional regulator [Burkholderiaceae bacterium]
MLLKVGELAKRSGLTVRTLHHFDQIGLLQPSARSEAGYRLYSRDDVARLHGIQALRHLGLPLKEIGGMLAGDGSALPSIVARQIRALDHEITQATELRARLALMMDRFSAGTQPEMADWLASLEMMATYARYFSADEIKRILGNWSRVEAEWPTLDAEVRQMMARGVAATDLAMQPLAHRWMGLIHHWLDGDFSLIERWGTMYKAEPVARQQNTGPDLSVVRYVEQATELRMARWQAHFTLADMGRFRWVPLSEWREVDAELQHLMARHTRPDDPAAQAACVRADALMSRSMGGDPLLLHKLAEAMGADPVLRAGAQLAPRSLAYLRAVRAARGA